MYMSLFACRCKYFSKCKSIKVAMSSSRACYSQLGPWPKLKYTPWNGEHVKKKSLDILQLGHLLRRLARASNPSWRPNRIRARVCFGLQEQPALKWTPQLHTGSDLSELYMVGKIILRRFQWNQFQAQIRPESMGIVRGSWRPESVPVLHHCFWADGPCIVLVPNRGASRGPSMTLGSSLTAATTSLGFGFCLNSFCQ